MNERIIKTCRDCNKPFSIAPEEQKWLSEKGLDNFSRCSACRDKRRSIQPITTNCKYCKQPFIITVDRQKWILSKHLNLPTKCDICLETIKGGDISD